jgi:hypothetical protein
MTEPDEIVAAWLAVQDAPSQARAEIFQSEALRLFVLVRQSKLNEDETVKALHEIAFSCGAGMNGVRAGEVIHKAMQGRRALDHPSQSMNGAATSSRLSAPVHKIIKATPYVWVDPTTIPERAWLYERHLIRKFVSAIIAPGAVGKTSLLIARVLAMISGRELLGKWSAGPLRVWLWTLEDPLEEMIRRIQAAAKHYGLTAADLGDRLFVDSGRDQRLVIAKTTRNGTEIMQPVVDNMVSECEARQIDVLIIDPFISCHEVAENDNPAIDLITKEWGRVAERANLAVGLSHHTRKMIGVEVEATTESARGGKALTDACRSVEVINRMTEKQGQQAGVENHRLYFRVFDDKPNLAPPSDKSDWYELVGVDLGNGHLGAGDNMGVVVPWKWPNHMEGITPAALLAVQKRVDGKGYRKNVQAKNWVGYAIAEVLELDPNNPADQSKIKAAVKTWIENGMLAVVEVKDEKGKDHPLIEVGKWADE